MVEVRNLTPHTGAILSGINVRSLDDETFEVISQVLYNRGVIVVRDQFLNPLELETLAERWGQPWLSPIQKPIDGTRYTLPIRNRGKDKAISERWHADSPYTATPTILSMLSAQNVPEVGGDTMWCNQYAVYDALPDPYKAALEPLRAVHYGRHQDIVINGFDSDLPGHPHPLIRTHPATGRKSLFISAHAEHFDGVSREDSAPLLNYLLAQLGKPEFTYRHQWQKGDLVVWDNRCVTHYAIHDYGDYPRLHYRVTTA